jgi:hypothetical protein
VGSSVTGGGGSVTAVVGASVVTGASVGAAVVATGAAVGAAVATGASVPPPVGGGDGGGGVEWSVGAAVALLHVGSLGCTSSGWQWLHGLKLTLQLQSDITMTGV